MGFYIQGNNVRKTQYLREVLKGEPFDVKNPPKWSNIPEGKVPVIVVRNFAFDAAGIAFCQAEYDVFTSPTDVRPRYGYLVAKELVIKECPSVEELLEK